MAEIADDMAVIKLERPLRILNPILGIVCDYDKGDVFLVEKGWAHKVLEADDGSGDCWMSPMRHNVEHIKAAVNTPNDSMFPPFHGRD